MPVMRWARKRRGRTKSALRSKELSEPSRAMPLWICADPPRGTIGLPPYLALTASALDVFDLRNQGVPLRLIVPGVRNGPREGQEASIDVARVGWRSKLLHRPDSCLRCQSMQNIELAHCLTTEFPMYGELLESGMWGVICALQQRLGRLRRLGGWCGVSGRIGAAVRGAVTIEGGRGQWGLHGEGYWVGFGAAGVGRGLVCCAGLRGGWKVR